jgi:phosphate transport system permease protein
MLKFLRGIQDKAFRLRQKMLSPILRLLVWASAAALISIITSLVGYIFIKGVPYLTPALFEWTYNSENVSLVPALINTLIMTALSLIIAAPLGIFSAVYLVEYAKRGNRLVSIIRMAAET